MKSFVSIDVYKNSIRAQIQTAKYERSNINGTKNT